MSKPRSERQVTQFEQLRDDWKLLGLYQRFESFVALILTAVIGLIIVVALVRLGATVVTGLLVGVLDPLEPAVFQTVFGEVLTVLIALEFNHTLQFVVARHQSIIQTKVVLLIALLAISRKFIVLDIDKTPPAELVGLAAITLALGIVYWLMRERDDRIAMSSKRSSG
jgi:uncharacterized membrane protein (DUF373 family)